VRRHASNASRQPPVVNADCFPRLAQLVVTDHDQAIAPALKSEASKEGADVPVWAQLFVVAFNLVPSVVDRTAHTVLARLLVLPAKDCAVVFLMSPPTLARENSRSLGLLVVLAAPFLERLPMH
jgi:hypothetical protein